MNRASAAAAAVGLVLAVLVAVLTAAGASGVTIAAAAAGCTSPSPSTSAVASPAPAPSAPVGCVAGDDEGDGLPVGGGTVTLPTGYSFPPGTTVAERAAIGFTLAQLGEPYRWGATGPDAWDCSGLTRAAWTAAGVPISRTTLTQIHDGTPVTSLAQLGPGDLVFIAGSEGTMAQPRHVGLYMGRGLIVEAPHTGDFVKIVPLAAWEPLIAAIRHIA